MCVGRQKHFQPLAVLAGSMGGVHGSGGVAASKLLFGPFPVGWGVKSGACERVWQTSETINRLPDKTADKTLWRRSLTGVGSGVLAVLGG
jgi:hypothetical protein